MSRRKIHVLATGIAIAIAAACSDQPTTPRGPAPSVSVATARLAEDIAHALRLPELRVAVRDAMRASPWDQHKLVLQEFASTPAGERLVAAIASARNTSSKALQAELAGLPALDFYMPVQHDRRTWTGDANLIVVAIFAGERTRTAYRPDGGTIELRAFERRTDLPPMIELQLAERKGHRVGAQLKVPGNVIEDPNDGQHSAIYEWHSANGEITTADLSAADANAQMSSLRAAVLKSLRGKIPIPSLDETCDPMLEVCDCQTDPTQPECQGGPGPGPSDTTFINSFITGICDNWDCSQADEFRFETSYYNGLGQFVGYLIYYNGTVYPGVNYGWGAAVVFNSVQTSNVNERLEVKLIEEDRNEPFGVNTDDICGYAIVHFADRNQPVYWPNTSDCRDDIHGYPNSSQGIFGWTLH